MIKVFANANEAWCGERELLTTGTVGKTVTLAFNDAWTGLQKFAVFRAYDISEALPITGDTLEIPARVLSKPDVHLMLGIYGINTQGTVAIPTVYVDLGCIREGANITGADNYVAPEQTLYAAIKEKADEAAASAADAASAQYAGSASFVIAGTEPTPVSGDPTEGHLTLTITYEGVTTVADLGIVTAYAEAVAGGYTGTHSEFQALLTANAQTEYEVAAALAAVDEVTSTASAAQSAAAAAATAATAANTAASAAQTAVAGKQAQHHVTSVNLASGQTAWTVSNVSYVTANNTVIVTPAPTSFAAWVAAGVYCSEQGAGTLKFTSAAQTTAQLTANVLILD